MIKPTGITAVFNRYHEDFVRFAARRLGCPQTAADIVQQTFEKVLRQPPDLVSNIQYLRAYIYKAIDNRCKNEYESRETKRRYRPLLAHADRLRTVDSIPGPEEIVAKLQFLEQLQAEVNRLPALRRIAFTLVEIQNHSVREAAGQMGISEMSVYQLINRAYALLAQRMVGSVQVNGTEKQT